MLCKMTMTLMLSSKIELLRLKLLCLSLGIEMKTCGLIVYNTLLEIELRCYSEERMYQQ